MFESDAAVYWRRRGVAIGGVVAVVLLLVWTMSGPSEPSSEEQAAQELNTAGIRPLERNPLDADDTPAAGEPVGPAGPSAPPSASALPSALPGAGLPPAGVPNTPLSSGQYGSGVSGSGAPASGLAVPSSSPSAALQPNGVPAGLPGAPATGSPMANVIPPRLAPSGGTGAQSAGAVPGSPTPGSQSSGVRSSGAEPSDAGSLEAGRSAARDGQSRLPGQAVVRPQAQAGPVPACSDRVTSVVAQTDSNTYKVGQKPHFQLVVTNTGKKPCARDLDAGLQEMVVTGPNQSRLWSSNDCFPAKQPDVRTLQPGTAQTFSLNWAGRTSHPRCAGQRTAIGPGAYTLVGKLGTLSSRPVRFTIVQ